MMKNSSLIELYSTEWSLSTLVCAAALLAPPAWMKGRETAAERTCSSSAAALLLSRWCTRQLVWSLAEMAKKQQKGLHSRISNVELLHQPPFERSIRSQQEAHGRFATIPQEGGCRFDSRGQRTPCAKSLPVSSLPLLLTLCVSG